MKQVYDSLAQFNIVKIEKEFAYDYGMQCYSYEKKSILCIKKIVKRVVSSLHFQGNVIAFLLHFESYW